MPRALLRGLVLAACSMANGAVTAPRRWINLSYANVATTAPAAQRIASEWADALARGGAAEFDGDAEASALLPLRAAGARLLGCSADDVCVGSSVTELLCSIAWACYPAGGTNIVSTAASFPSTVYPWRRVAAASGATLRLAPHDASYRTDPESLLALIDEETSVVCGASSGEEARTSRPTGGACALAGCPLTQLCRASHRRCRGSVAR